MTALRRFGLLAPLVAFSLAGCGLNSVPTAEEQVNAAWGNLQADYQRRADDHGDREVEHVALGDEGAKFPEHKLPPFMRRVGPKRSVCTPD